MEYCYLDLENKAHKETVVMVSITKGTIDTTFIRMQTEISDKEIQELANHPANKNQTFYLQGGLDCSK